MSKKMLKVFIVAGIAAILNVPGIRVENQAKISLHAEEDIPGETGPEIEAPKGYTLKCREPDGKRGYYISPPEITIIHRDEGWVTGYAFTKPDGTELKGKIFKENAKGIIETSEFQDGISKLDVWIENAEGIVYPKFQVQKSFALDTGKPEIDVKIPGGFEQWHGSNVKLQVRASESGNGSGIDKIRCYEDGELVKEDKKETLETVLTKESTKGAKVPVRIEVWDKAGNRSAFEKGILIDKRDPDISAEGAGHCMITGKEVNIVFKVRDDNVLKDMEAGGEWENEDGTVSRLPRGVWKFDGENNTASMILKQNGIYRLFVTASDQAGHQVEKKLQVIIDKTNPVIRYLDGLKGKCMKEFRWNYHIEDTIQDFTTYTYEMKLDRRPYVPGRKVVKEGKHVLSVSAEDSAGNASKATAEFVIDNTSPDIIIKGVKNGGHYEEEQTLKISLGDKQDEIESVKINGETQKLLKNSRISQYSFKEPGNYIIEVKAKDAAENRSSKQIDFQIREKESILKKAVRPIQRLLGLEEKTGTEIKNKKETKKSDAVYLVAAVLLFLCLIMALVGVSVYFRKKKNSKKTP